MTLENILKGIEKKVLQEVENIRKEAQNKEKEILSEKKNEALKLKNEILKKSEEELQREERERIITAQRKEKMLNLKLRRRFLDEAFNQAQEKILHLPRKKYLQLFKRALLYYVDSSTEEIITNLKDGEWLKEELPGEKNLKSKLKIIPHLSEKERGFILRKKEIQINCTLSTFFLSLREKLETEVAQKLFI